VVKLPSSSSKQLAPAEHLAELIALRMPFGKYKGQLILDVPEAYLLWLKQHDFPKGKLGMQLMTALEIKANGLLPLLEPLRARQRALDDVE
jgi:hypothetical protein